MSRSEPVEHKCRECGRIVLCYDCIEPDESQCPWNLDDTDEQVCIFCAKVEEDEHQKWLAEMSEAMGVCTCPSCLGIDENDI